MATIGSLAVNVVAKTDNFSKGMRGARKDLSLFGTATDSIKGKLVGLGSTLALGFAAKFSFGEIRKAGEEIDALAKRADILQSSLEGLGGLSRTAELAGSSAEGIGQGLQFMERALNSNSDAFQALGLDVNKLRQQRPESIFLDIADAMKEVSDTGKRLQLTKDIFGKGGTGLLPTMLQGSDSIRAEMSSQPGFSRADAQVIEEMNDAGTRLTQTFQQLEGVLAVKFGPSVESLVTTFNRFMGGANSEGAARWEKEFSTWSDKDFTDFRTNYEKPDDGWFGDMLTVRDPDVLAAFRMRDTRMADDLEKRNASKNPGMSGSMMPGLMGGLSTLGMNMAMTAGMQGTAAMIDKIKTDEWNDMGGNKDVLRMSAMMAEMQIAGNAPMGMGAALRRPLDQVQGNAAHEYGTAAAFSQERRSSQAGKLLDNSNKQTKLQQDMVKGLHNLDATMKNAAKIEVVNLA